MSELPPIQLPVGFPPFINEKAENPGDLVLILSREKDTRILLKAILEIWGYQTFEFDPLEEALSVIEIYKPKLILLDTVLPFESNLKLIRQIRKVRFSNKIPLIVLSGFSQPLYKNLSISVGADDFLVKPLDFDTLENKLYRNIRKYSDIS